MKKIALALALLLALSTAGFAANTHMVSYRLDPATPRPHQDFDLYLTFKSDQAYSVDSMRIGLECPPELSCMNMSATLPPYGVQEFRFPIRSNASGGVLGIAVRWDDGSSRFVYNNATGISSSERIWYDSTVNVDVKEYRISDFTVSGPLYTNELDNFTVSFAATGLHNVQVSLYSDCIAFSSPVFYYSELDGNVSISTPARVSCQSGSHDAVFTLSSDEMGMAASLGVKVEKKQHAKLSAVLEAGTHYVGKDYYVVDLENTGAKAEKLSVSVASNSAVNSPDVSYLGDFTGERATVFEIEGKKAGKYPVTIEARWSEGDESFSQTFDSDVEFVDREANLLPFVVGACVLAILYMATRKKRQG
ncbi:MAG: hypothetical protein WCY41_02385 [Candidatus Micrarchaeia archaeon]